MRIDLVPTGANPPDNLNVLIEVPIGGEPVKYEFDKASDALYVDRSDLPAIVMQQIEHFFTHYKDLEPGKWVKVSKWGRLERAVRPIHCRGIDATSLWAEAIAGVRQPLFTPQ